MPKILEEQDIDLQEMVEMLVESRVSDLVLKLDDIGWNPLGNELNHEEVPLDTIKEVSDTVRALVAINPLVKRGVAVRTSYIWNKGINFQGIDADDPILTHPLNKKFLFSSEALAEAEKCLATDGNFLWLAQGSAGRRSATAPTGMRVPIQQIVGIVTNPDNNEEIWFYRRKWKRTVWQKTTDKVSDEDVEEYIPSDLYDVTNGKPRRIRNVKVNWDAVLIEHSVNKQVGWRWGLPDAMSVVFWAKAHKEFLEDCTKLIKAYSRFAFKMTAPTPQSVRALSTKVTAQPQRGFFGDKQDIGQTFVGPQGSNLQAVGRSAGSVDFSAGVPLAGYVAAGLEIPLTDLLADSGLSNRSASETLSESKLAAMVARQKSWASFFERLFKFWGKDVEAVFPKIETDPAYRAIQSIALAATLNVLSAEEVRELLVAALDLKTEDDLPTEEELGLLILQMTKQQEQAEAAAEAQAKAKEQNAASYGDNTNRDEVGQHEYTHGDDGK